MYYRNEDDLKLYMRYAKDNGYNYIVILKDLEEKDIFPAYFITIEELNHYCNCLISESKIQVLEVLRTV